MTMPQLFPVRSMDAVFRNNYEDARSEGARVHQGIDVGVIHDGRRRTGDLILSATPGTVVTVRRETSRGEPRSGNSVTVRDPDGWMHHYAHMLEEPFVTEGSSIVAGTPLGRVGATGNARNTGAHLHYQIEYRGRRINPYPALAAGYAAMRTGVPDPSSLGDETVAPRTEATATPDEREAARELYRRLQPAYEAVLGRAEGWTESVWTSLYVLQHGARAREARALLQSSASVCHAMLDDSKRLASQGHYIAAMIQLRTSASLLGSAMAPLNEMHAELPDSIKAVVASAMAFSEFFLPGSTYGFTSPVAMTLANRAAEFGDDLTEAAGSAGGIAIVAVIALAAWALSRG